MFVPLAFLTTLICLTQAFSLPPELEICHRKDPKLNECIKRGMETSVKLFKDGYDDLELPPLDPFFIPQLVLIQSRTNKNFHLSLSYFDLYIRGFQNVKFETVDVTTDGNKVKIFSRVLFPELIFDGKYELYGKLLLFGLKGKDKSHMELGDMRGNFSLTLELDDVDGDGNKFYVLKDASYDAGIPAKKVFKFENIIKGNAKLSQQMNKLMEQNSDSLQEAFKPSIDSFFTSIFVQSVSKLFSIIPADKILPD